MRTISYKNWGNKNFWDYCHPEFLLKQKMPQGGQIPSQKKRRVQVSLVSNQPCQRAIHVIKREGPEGVRVIPSTKHQRWEEIIKKHPHMENGLWERSVMPNERSWQPS